MFNFPKGTVYLDAARLHPLPTPSVKAIQSYLEVRQLNPVPDWSYFVTTEARVKKSFAQLINATPAEIAFTPSAQVSENLVLAGLGLDRWARDADGEQTGNIVTDALHYRGAMYLYGEMSRRGFDIRVVQPRENRIHLEDLAAQIDSQTKLVALSLVSNINGFQHDLKAVCEIAHAKGALVYADIVQAAGAIPIDVRESGVDFCGATAHKWLMGDHGLGFLYVRPSLFADGRVQRTQFGTDQLISYTDDGFALDGNGGRTAGWVAADDAAGHFEVGMKPSLVMVSLVESLEYINRVGATAIQAKRRPLIKQLMREVPKLGYPSVTPTPDTGIATFRITHSQEIEARLKARNITVTLSQRTMRVSPSMYNTNADIEVFLSALRA
jgi:selenocysteine lyase/cysteine desulfurase